MFDQIFLLGLRSGESRRPHDQPFTLYTVKAQECSRVLRNDSNISSSHGSKTSFRILQQVAAANLRFSCIITGTTILSAMIPVYPVVGIVNVGDAHLRNKPNHLPNRQVRQGSPWSRQQHVLPSPLKPQIPVKEH